MNVITAHERYAKESLPAEGQIASGFIPVDSEKAVFVGGGISGCPNWQAEFIERLHDLPITLLNPRRAAFDMNAADSLAHEQIVWEYDHLRKADAIVFWFPHETLCPITLYELGAWSMTEVPLFIGAHPDYVRRFDVVTQTSLIRPEITIVDSLDALADQVRRAIPPTEGN